MRKLFYGWYVALGCGIGLACGLASVLTYTFGVFVTPLRAEFNWSQTEVFAALFLCVLTMTFVAPFFGLLVDRLGARRVILAGLVFEAALIASFYFQDANILSYYLRYVALAVLGVGTTHIAFTRIIALWFDRQRGLALGVTLAGVGIGGFAWPILTQWAIDAFGWRSAWLVIAAAIILVGGTIVLLVVRDSPQSMGLLPDGDTAVSSRNKAAKSSAPGVTLKQALATRHFWMMLVIFLLIGAAVTSIQVHLVPLLISRGVTPMRAANALSILAVALLFGRVAAGWLMDRIFAPRVAIAFLLGPVVAIFLLASGASGWLAFVAGILTGLAAGAEVDVTAYLVSRYFGLQHFSSIYAWYYSAYSLGAGLGPLATANAVDRFGGYTEILLVHALMLVIATLLLTRLPAFPTGKPA